MTDPDSERESRPPRAAQVRRASRLATALLVLAAVFLGTTIVASVGWYLADRSDGASLAGLDPEERQRLFEEMVEASPAVFETALFEPLVGYTLRPGQRMSAYGDTFTANDIGFRTHPSAKPEGVFRVVFVGDSWTYGLGVSESESFPAQFERVANEILAGAPRVQAFNLGLPGYNGVNAIAALEFFLDRLQPDAVVYAPIGNDMNSGHGITAEGHLTRWLNEPPVFADGVWVQFKSRLYDSHVLRSRWRTVFGRLRATAERLRERGVPLLVFFVAVWDEAFAHRLMSGSGLDAPYLVLPPRLASRELQNPPPFRHASPEANRLYGRIVYRALGEVLGWRVPPRAEGEPAPALHRAPPEGDWARPSREIMRSRTADKVPAAFRAGAAARWQCVGAMDCASGLAGRQTMVLVRRREGAQRLRITVARVPEARWLYPLAVAAEVPSPAGGSAARSVIPADGPAEHAFELPLPADLPPGAALDVILRAERAASAPDVRAPRSFLLREVVPLP